MVFEGESFTFTELNERANRLANSLTGLGIEKGDRVAILQVNCNQYVEAYYAVAKVGAVLVPLNFRLNEHELTHILNHSGSIVLLVGKRYVDLVNSMRSELPLVKHYISIEGKEEGMLDYDELIAGASDEEVLTESADEDTTILVYTAGTTSVPKGVPLSHNSFSIYILDSVNPVDPDIEETNLLSMPLYHIAGVQAMLAATYGGRTLVIMRQFDVNDWLELVQRERANRVMLVPTMLKRIIDHPDLAKYDLSSLSVVTYGGAPMHCEVIKKAIRLFPGVSFINAFGQTETASTITTLGPEDHIIEGTDEEKKKKLRRLSLSIGRPMPDVEVKIIGEDGGDLPLGEIGEIVARGPRVMSGYWQNGDKTAEAFTKDGWLHTRDMGYMDEEGYFYLAARADGLIIRGGENISPEEVEDVLYCHPAIHEAAVVGVPSEEWGQEPRAIVVLKDGMSATPEEIIEFCRERLASFKRPRSVVFIDELPRTSTGKVMKRILLERHGTS